MRMMQTQLRLYQRHGGVAAVTAAAAAAASSLIYSSPINEDDCSRCEAPTASPLQPTPSPSWAKSTSNHPRDDRPRQDGDTTASRLVNPSWLRRRIMVPIGLMGLPVPRRLTADDPALQLSPRCLRQRQRDEERVRNLLEREIPALQSASAAATTAATSTANGDHDPVHAAKMNELSIKLYELTYGRGVTPQLREDFLIRYGCTGWTDQVVDRLLDLCETRGMVEIGAGHGQWARTLNEAYHVRRGKGNGKDHKTFDFVLAYDDNSNLPLNPQIYHPYTKPHHDYFGHVRTLKSNDDVTRVLQSWACRGRALLLVYPPPGDMAVHVLRTYVEAAQENDTLVYVGEGRGGANADDEFFDVLESGNWILLETLDVLKPPGDKGYEKIFVLQKAWNLE